MKQIYAETPNSANKRSRNSPHQKAETKAGTNVLIKRAKRKVITNIVKNKLSEINSPLKSKYKASLSCSNQISIKEGKTHTKTCKKAWCIICQAIRTATRMNLYEKQLAALPELQLTTLTCENCNAEEINKVIDTYKAFFRNWRNKYYKKYNSKFSGVYNVEFTINQKANANTYHIHIHITHEGIHLEESYTTKNGKKVKGYVNDICLDWISYATKKGIKTDIKGQDARPVIYNNEGKPELKEVFKYQSKSIFSQKENGKNESIIPVNELDIMYQKIQNKHCFEAFGKLTAKTEEEENQEMEKAEGDQTEKPEGEYNWKKYDWTMIQNINPETGEIRPEICDQYYQIEIPLSGYEPKEKTIEYYNKLEKNQYYKVKLQ